MPAPTVTVEAPPPTTYFDPGILRPNARVSWSGTTGPDDVLHEWDTVNTFDSPNLIQDSNAGASSPDTGTPPSDLGPAGTAWYYRVTVTDTSDSASTTSTPIELGWVDPITFRRYLYLLTNISAAFYPTDTAVLAEAADGDVKDFRRYLYLLANISVAFYPTDTAVLAEAADGDVKDFRRYLYLLANADDTVPTPHIWYVYPDFGREGWEFKIIGYGFGDTQATYNGTVLLNALGCSVIEWQAIAQSSPDLTIDPENDIAEPIHQEVRAVVPVDAESGLVFICTDA